MRRRTPYLKMGYFTTGESYRAEADMQRLRSIEDTIDVAMKITGGGVIRGWDVYKSNDVNPFQISVAQGLGIIPINPGDNQEWNPNVPEIDFVQISDTPIKSDPHYMGIRTNGDIEIANPSVGPSRISVVYVKLNNTFITQFQNILSVINPDQVPVTLTIGSGDLEQSVLINSNDAKWSALETLTQIESEVEIEVIPGVDALASSGAYRNLVPQTDFPIYKYNIEGEINYNNLKNDYTVFINGKAFHNDGFVVNSSEITFNSPLQPEDVVNIRIEPKHGLVLAEVETDESEIIRIDNSVRTSVYEKIGDELVREAISEHIHNGAADQATKVLLTTETSLFSPYEISSDRKTFKFNKPDSNKYQFAFNANTYREEIYINNLLSIDPYTLADTGTEINIIFSSAVSENSIVKMKLVIKEDYTEIEGKLVINDSNPSRDKITIKADADSITEGFLYSDLIPQLSHEGIKDQVMRPTNPWVGSSDDIEYVHFCETLEIGDFGKEFYPIYKDKSSARQAVFLYSSPDSSSDDIFACASGGLLYARRDDLVGANPNNLFEGWDVLSRNGIDSYGAPSSEYDNPFLVANVKNSIRTTNVSYAIGEKFVYQITWNADGIPVVNEKINLTNDRGTGLITVPGSVSSIVDACDAEGILNLTGSDYTFYFLADNNRVYVYEYSQGATETLLDITSEPLWDDAISLFSSQFSENDVLFVADDNNDLYLNQLITLQLGSSISPGGITVQGTFSPSGYVSISDSVIFATSNSFGQKTQISDVQSTFIDISPTVSQRYLGLSGGIYNTVILKDWIKISDSDFSGTVKRVIGAYDKIFVLTSTDIYSAPYSSDIYGVDSELTWTRLTSVGVYSGLNDFADIGDNYFIIAGESGIYKAYYNGSSLTISESSNSTYGESLNDMLFPAYYVRLGSRIAKNSGVVYICGKYGIFQSTDQGVSWRNTIQFLGRPDDRRNPAKRPATVLSVIDSDDSLNRIYVQKKYVIDHYSYGYGYGSGVVGSLDYFDVLNYESANWGYDITPETAQYAYGYGYEIENPVVGIEESDWIYYEEDSSSMYGQNPLRILGTGFDYAIGSYYIDVEEYDGYESDLSLTFANQDIYIYKKVFPLAMIDDSPQSTLYGVVDVNDYSFNYYRQSVKFSSYVEDEIDKITVASQYKYYQLVEDYDLSDFIEVDDKHISWTSSSGDVYGGEVSLFLNGIEFKYVVLYEREGLEFSTTPITFNSGLLPEPLLWGDPWTDTDGVVHNRFGFHDNLFNLVGEASDYNTNSLNYRIKISGTTNNTDGIYYLHAIDNSWTPINGSVSIFFKTHANISDAPPPVDFEGENIKFEFLDIVGTSERFFGPWIRNGNIFQVPQTWNYDNLIKLTARGVTLGDIGIYDHFQIEDKISINETGYPYEMDGVRNSNFLSVLMALQHSYSSLSSVSGLEETTGTITAVYDPHIGGVEAYIEDSSKIFGTGALVGRNISITKDGTTRNYTVSNNDTTKLYIQKQMLFNRYNANASDGSKLTTFSFNELAQSGSVRVYVDYLEVTTGWSYNTNISGDIVGVVFDTSPAVGTDEDVWVSMLYLDRANFIDLNDFIEIGDTYTIEIQSISPFDTLVNTFVSMYDETDFPFDLVYSFVETSLIEDVGSIQDDVGVYGHALFSVYYDEANQVFYAGTNTGVWKNEYSNTYFVQTNPMLTTLDATGSIDIAKTISDVYVQYNRTTGEWTVSWGGGFNSDDENNNLEEFEANSVAIAPGNTDIILVASDHGVFRTLDGTNWNTVWDTVSDDRTSEYPAVKKIVFDDKHPWVVNAILSSGLYRSYNYGSTWTLINEREADSAVDADFMDFAYQKDSSDGRGAYYFVHDKFVYKPESFLGPYGQTGATAGGEKEWSEEFSLDYDKVFRNGISSISITGIANSQLNVNNVFFSSPSYGLYRSYMLGYAPEFGITTLRNNYTLDSGVVSSDMNSSFLNSIKDSVMTRSAAFMYLNTSENIVDKDYGDFGYFLFVDKTYDKTYVSVDRSSKFHTPLQDGDLVGSYVFLKNDENQRYYKVLAHYDRGPSFGNRFYKTYNSDILSDRKIEFVLDGQVSTPGPWGAENNYTSVDGTFEIARWNPDSGKKWFYAGTLGVCHGRQTKLKLKDLSDLNCRVYAVREDGIFDPLNYGLGVSESTADITYLILDFQDVSDVPDFISTSPSSLAGYSIGDSRQGEQYTIFEAKDLPSASAYFIVDQDSYGYGYGYGSDLSYAYGYGYGYDIGLQTGYSYFDVLKPYVVNGRQFAVRIQSDDTTLTRDNDPFDLWIRCDHHELHNKVLSNYFYDTPTGDDTISNDLNSSYYRKAHFSQIANVSVNVFPRSSDSPDSIKEDALWIAYDRGFGTQGYEAWILWWPYVDPYSISGDHLAAEQYIGKYVGHFGSNIRYKIIDAVVWDDSYDEKFPPEYDQSNVVTISNRYLLRLEPIARAYCDQAALFSNGEISAIDTNKLTLSVIGQDPFDSNNDLIGDDDLKGFSVVNTDTNATFLITANENNELTLSSQIIDSLFDVGGLINIDYSIPFTTCTDVDVYNSGASESVFTLSNGYCYESRDNGDSWRILFDGLGLSSTTGKPTIKLYKIKVSGNNLYAVSLSKTVGGLFVCPLTSTDRVWTQVVDIGESSLASLGMTDLSIEGSTIVVGTENGVYRLVSGGTWEKMVLPDTNVTAVLAVDNDINFQPTGLSDIKGDLDRLWIGTGGHGFYIRAKENKDSITVETNWQRSKLNDYFEEVRATDWFVKEMFYEDSKIKAKILFDNNGQVNRYGNFEYTGNDFYPISSSGISDVSVFEWEKNLNKDPKRYLYENSIFIVDPSNSGYFNRGTFSTGTSNSSQKYHKFNNFSTSVEGWRKGSALLNKDLYGSLRKTDVAERFDGNFNGVYENPFKHTPDKSSITTIKSVPDGDSGEEGTVIFGTDRNGVWRTTSGVSGYKRPGYILPKPVGDYTIDDISIPTTWGNEFGYDHVPWKYWIRTASETDPSNLDPVLDLYDNAKFLVATGGVGDWSGHDDEIAVYDLAGTSWTFISPYEGLYVWDLSATFTNNALLYTGGSWVIKPELIYESPRTSISQPWFGVDSPDLFRSGVGQAGDTTSGNYIGTNFGHARAVLQGDDSFYFKRVADSSYFLVYEDVNDGDNGNNLYQDISDLDDIQDLVGAYLVVSENMNEVHGPSYNNDHWTSCKIWEIKEIQASTWLGSSVYQIRISSGETYGIDLTNDSNKQNAALARWVYEWDYRNEEDYGPNTEYTKETGWAPNRNARICIMDFEKYEQISTGLPTVSGLKNSQGNDECGLFIRDMKVGDVVSGKYPTVMACGINGVYWSEDVIATSVVWQKWTLDATSAAFPYDATSVDYDSSTGIAYIGTWGNGVYQINIDGTGALTAINDGLNHLKIWCLFRDSSTNLYVGTENGGIYKYTETSPTVWEWVRETGLTRSQIFMWKSEGIPVRIEDSGTSPVFDYQYSDNILSYSWGGGIMQSINGSAAWEQANTNLSNLYIQDISICSTPSDELNGYFTSYVASCGGGVFRADNTFEVDGEGIPQTSWKPLSSVGLPETLNIVEVESTFDPDIIFIKININDLSLKDVPYRMRSLASSYLDGFPDVAYYEDEEGAGGRYLPFSPYEKGIKKHVIYKGTITDTSGDIIEVTWEKIYDKDPEITGNYVFSSKAFGLTVVPGSDSEIRFVYNYYSKYQNTTVFETLYVGIDGSSITEKVINKNWIAHGFSGQDFDSYRSRSEVYLTVDPTDTSTAYLALANPNVESNTFAIYATHDDGTTWSNDLKPTDQDYKCGFNNGIKISTKKVPLFTESFPVTYTISTSGTNTVFTILTDAGMDSRLRTDGALTNYNISFDTDYSGVHSISDHDYNVSTQYAVLTIPGVVTGTSSFNIFANGSVIEIDLLALSYTWTNNGTSTTISFPYSGSYNSIVITEGVLIGCELGVGSNFITTGTITDHNVDITGNIDLVITGVFTGTKINIVYYSPIYASFGNDVYGSVSQGQSWFVTENGDIFSNPLINVKGVAEYPVSNIPSATPPLKDIVKSKFVLFEYLGIVYLYRGDLREGDAATNTVWTNYSIASPTIDPNNLLEDCLRYTDATTTMDAVYTAVAMGSDEKAASGTLYISEKTKIRDAATTDVYYTGAVEFPLVISTLDSGIMSFISGDTIYYSLTAFVNSLKTITLPFSGESIKKILLVADNSSRKEIFIGVNSDIQYKNITADIVSIFQTSTANSVVVETPTEFFIVGDKISFSDETSTRPYTSEIVEIYSGGKSLTLVPTISVTVDSAVYDQLNNITVFTCTADTTNLGKYEGTIFRISDNISFTTVLYEGIFDNYEIVSNTSFKLKIAGELISYFNERLVNFNTSKAYLRIGKITDITNSMSFSGRVVTSRPISTNANGLWYSAAYGEGLYLVESAQLGDFDFGCDNVFMFDNGALSVVSSKNNVTRILINDLWMPSATINTVTLGYNGQPIIGTDNGIGVLYKGTSSKYFNNYYFGDFKVFAVGNNVYHIFDDDGNFYIHNEEFTGVYNGYDGLSATVSNVSDVNKSIVDTDGNIWIASDNGLYVYGTENLSNVFFTGYTVKDLMEDVSGRVWACLGENGLAVAIAKSDNLNYEWIEFDEADGLVGDINTICERYGISFISDGDPDSGTGPAGVDTPYIQIDWNNNSSLFGESVLLRSRTTSHPDLTGLTVSNRITAKVSSVSSASISIDGTLTDVWAITLKQKNVFSIEADELVGKYMFFNSKEDDTNRLILGNTSTDIIYVGRTSTTVPTVAENDISIVDLVESASAMFVGDATEISSRFIDRHVYDSTYFYHLYFKKAGETEYSFVDTKEIVMDSIKRSSTLFDIYCAGSGGVFVFDGFDTIGFILQDFFGEVTHIFVDSINRMWMSVGEHLFIYTSGGYEQFDKNYLFFDQTTVPSGDLVVGNCIEGVDGFIYVSTNLGLASFSLNDETHISYIENDADRLAGYRDGVLTKLDKWHVSSSFGNTNTGFGKGSIAANALLATSGSINITETYGLKWTYSSEGVESPRFFISIYNEAETSVLYYSVIGNGVSKHVTSSGVSELETLPYYDSSADKIGSPGHIYVLESSTGTGMNGTSLLVGVVNNKVIEDEVEIVSMAFAGGDVIEPDTITRIGASQGLAIQSVYGITEISGSIYAGCKDYIAYDGISGWRVVPWNNDPVFGLTENWEEYAFTSVHGRVDASAIESYEGKVVYATRTPLYGDTRNSKYSENLYQLRTGNNSVSSYNFNYYPNEVFSFRVGLSGLDYMPIDQRVIVYEFSEGLIDTSDLRILPYVDEPGFIPYYGQIVTKDVLSGHRGAINFIDSQKTLLVGGFDNIVFASPFTAEKIDLPFKDKVFKKAVSFVSGRRSIADTQFPITNQSYNFGWELGFQQGVGWTVPNYIPLQLGSRWSLNTKFGSYVKPKDGWMVSFDDEVGYAGFFQFGNNTDKLDSTKTPFTESAYRYSSNSDLSYMSKTNDQGMIWQQFTNSDYSNPNIALSGLRYDGTDLFVTSIYGSGKEGVGVYKVDSLTRTWEQCTLGSFHPLPSLDIKEFVDEIYVGTAGAGMFKFVSGLDFTEYSSRFNTEYGLGVGRWYVNSIIEDANNRSRVLAATQQQGVLECLNATDDAAVMKWQFDSQGLPSGNIGTVQMLPTNPAIVFAGVEGDGLYRKNPTTLVYEKITSGLPTTGSLKQVFIDSEIRNVFISFTYSYTGSKDLFVMRSSMGSPSTEPTDGILYQQGYTVGNADIIYIGDAFVSDLYRDTSKKLRDSDPYYYRFYERDGKTYTEIDTYTGEISSISLDSSNIENSVFTLTFDSVDFGSADLSGRIITFNPNGLDEQRYVIYSNTATTVIVRFDELKEINKGFFDSYYFRGFTFKVESTFVKFATTINPVYIIFEDSATSKGELYVSQNNGIDWTKIGFEGVFVFSIPSINNVLVKPVIGYSTSVNSRTFYAATDSNVLRSENNGSTWDVLSTDLLLYTGAANPYYNGLPNIYDENDGYVELFVDEEDANIVYAVTRLGSFYRSINNGLSWDLVNASGKIINDVDMVSFGTNYIYSGCVGDGIVRFDDPIRDSIKAEMNIDGKLTFFDIDYLEMGDQYFTDSNSFIIKTLFKNDDSSDTREQVRFKTDDITKFLSFKFTKNNVYVNPELIHIGGEGYNPYNNPFILQNPTNSYDNIVVNKIGNVSDSEIYALTNQGAYTSLDDGSKWKKIRTSSLPDEIYTISVSGVENEIVLGTEKGLWLSENERESYRLIESDNKTVRVLWDYFDSQNGYKYLFRGGENGLFITVENLGGIIVYSGDKKQNTFSWGDLFYPNDGGWSDRTKDIIDEPIMRPIGPNTNILTAFSGWDGALIIRRGPFINYENALLNKDKIFRPNQQVVYPGGPSTTSNGYIFRSINDYSGYLEEVREANLFGGIGSTFKLGRSWMYDGSIVIGNVSVAPTTRLPVIDEVQPFDYGTSGLTLRTLAGMHSNIAEDVSYYDGTITDSPLRGKARGPELLENMYYIYRAYPWIMLPDPMVVGTGLSETYATFPRYRPESGDSPDSYSYNLSISKFSGSKTILSGTSVGSSNWVVGTDNGIFYSTSHGTDIKRSKVVGQIPAMIYTSQSVVLAVVVLEGGQIQILSSSEDRTAAVGNGKYYGEKWSVVPGIQRLFFSAEIKRVYSFTEYNGRVYLATNSGLLSGNVDGSDWVLHGSVGNIESLSNYRALGQGFSIG